jgi:hypothetical protein
VGSIIEGKKYYRLRVRTKRRVGDLLMEMEGMKARIKVKKPIKIYLTIKKGWRQQLKSAERGADGEPCWGYNILDWYSRYIRTRTYIQKIDPS